MPEPGGEGPLNFEAGLQQLEAIVKEMEGGDLPLERALELFERGMKLSGVCRKQDLLNVGFAFAGPFYCPQPQHLPQSIRRLTCRGRANIDQH